MRVTAASLFDLWVLEADQQGDARGTFERVFDAGVLRDVGMRFDVTQVSLSRTTRRRTLRGMHYQRAPSEERKLVRCVGGTIYDVVIDLRPGSPTYREWQAWTLDGESAVTLVVPPGCAHGFVTLTDDVAVLYAMDAAHDESSAAGVRWDDPAFDVAWPVIPEVISDRDRQYPDFDR